MITLSQTTEQMLSVEALPLAGPELKGNGGGTTFIITVLMIGLGAAVGYAVGFDRGTTLRLRGGRRESSWT